MSLSTPKEQVVVALGGNALMSKAGDTFETQIERAEKGLLGVLHLIKGGYDVVITHGNGPQVGAALLRMELSSKEVTPLPLYACGAQTQGEIGLVISSALGNLFKKEGIDLHVSAMVTQVVVSKDDPDFQDPTKYIGTFYSEEEAKKMRDERGWTVKEDKGRGWRRVVPSPWPKRIVEAEAIKLLIENGVIVIATGGGGIPVIEENGHISGVDAVIDKDRASAILANEIKADKLLILTGVETVCTGFGTPEQKTLSVLSREEAKALLDSGEFPPGNMGPKVEAAIHFLENGGSEVIITSIEKALEAVEGKTGTRIF